MTRLEWPASLSSCPPRKKDAGREGRGERGGGGGRQGGRDGGKQGVVEDGREGGLGGEVDQWRRYYGGQCCCFRSVPMNETKQDNSSTFWSLPPPPCGCVGALLFCPAIRYMGPEHISEY